jgi:hypothetical protein
MEEGLDRDNLYMTLFEAAARCPAAEREAYLRNACACDPELVEELLDRLEWQDRMGDFLIEPLISRLEVNHPFQAGDLVGERFRIVREIAEGGMGVVYEAIDEKLEQRRALKCAKPGHYRRLSPEARSALKVTHDNVCRVYEIHTAASPNGPVDFLAMEYLEGETLAARLERSGPLPDGAAREIARQLCLGLRVTTKVHRDLKSNNIMLAGGCGRSAWCAIGAFVRGCSWATGTSPVPAACGAPGISHLNSGAVNRPRKIGMCSGLCDLT